MGKLYAKAVVAGTRTLDSVPAMWRDATLTALGAMCTQEELERILEQED